MLRWMTLALAVLLGLVQVRDSAALAGLARAPAWPLLMPQPVRSAAAGGALVPPALGVAIAREAIAAGRVGEARSIAERLSPGNDREDLEAAIDERSGGPYAAMDGYLRAGDGVAAQRLVDSSAATDLGTAIALQRRVLASVAAQPLRVKDQAEAWWRLGQLEQGAAYRLPPGAARTVGERAALDAYERAHGLAALDEKYLLAAANGALNIGDLATARSNFEALLALDGGSVDSTLGLADTLLRSGDADGARRFIDRAAALGAGERAERLRRLLP